jgi:anaerobic magnesium-protoporphyrin IX monomethyl ester cyclase
MKVLLIEPPINAFTGLVKRGYPIGLCMLAAVAHRDRIAEVKVYDADKSAASSDGLDFTNQRQHMAQYLEGVNDVRHPVWKPLTQVLDAFKPDVVGITTMTIQYASALQTAKIVKEWNRDCTVILGGPHASVMPRLMIDWPHADIVVNGEGEAAFPEILKRLRSNRREIETIPGVITKDSAGGVAALPQEIEHLDDLPFPDRRALMQPESYSPEDMGLILTSRGCPYHCSYCSNFTRKTRFRSVEKVLAEVCEVQAAYGTRQFMFKDDSFTLRRERVTEFCQQIVEKRIHMLWECTTRLDLLDDHLMGLMKRAGCNRVGVGIESGDDEMLQIYNKRLTKQRIREGVKVLQRSGVFWTGYFMMALPMETEDQILRTLEFMTELKPSYAAIGVYKPYPGTKLFAMAEELGLVDSKVENTHFFNTNPVDYFLADPHRRCAHIPEERLAELVARLQREFERSNKRLSNVFGRALSRRKLYLADPQSLFVDLKRAVKWLVP